MLGGEDGDQIIKSQSKMYPKLVTENTDFKFTIRNEGGGNVFSSMPWYKKTTFASLSSVHPAHFGNSQVCIYLNHSLRCLWIHCDRSTTNWPKPASSPLTTWLLSPLMCIERLVTCIQLQPLHLSSLDLFLVWSKKQARFFFFTSKPPRRGWLHGIHHHASLMTSGQEHGVKSQ